MSRFAQRDAADSFVAALPKRTRDTLGAALEKRARTAKLDKAGSYYKELLKRLQLEAGEDRMVAWALVRAGLVERQSPFLWLILSAGIEAHVESASAADVITLLEGVTDPAEGVFNERDGYFRSGQGPSTTSAFRFVPMRPCCDHSGNAALDRSELG